MSRRKFIKKTSRAGAAAVLGSAYNNPSEARESSGEDPHICIFSKHMQWLGWKDMARLAAEIGFTGIDLTVRPKGHVFPENVKRDLPEAVKIIRDAGLEVPMITTSITDPDDPVTADIVETAGHLGIKIYRTGWYRYGRGMNTSELLDHASRQLSKLQELNETHNITAAYQNHAGDFLGSSGWDLLRIIEHLDPRWMGVQFDICHATVEGPDTWPFVFELLAPYINSLDIKDFTWEVENGKAKEAYVPLGQGTVDFKTFFDMLERSGSRSDYSVHFEYPLGGAEHGSRELEIPAEKFTKQASADLAFVKQILDRT